MVLWLACCISGPTGCEIKSAVSEGRRADMAWSRWKQRGSFETFFSMEEANMKEEIYWNLLPTVGCMSDCGTNPQILSVYLDLQGAGFWFSVSGGNQDESQSPTSFFSMKTNATSKVLISITVVSHQIGNLRLIRIPSSALRPIRQVLTILFLL